MSNYTETTKEFDYVAGYEVDSGIEVPDGMTKWHIPEQTYAVIRCTIPTIQQAYQYFTDEWAPKERYRRANSPEFEYYPEIFNSTAEETS